jgi:hypothetical protein
LKFILLGDGEGNAWLDQQDEDQQWLNNKQKEKVQLANQAENIDNNNKQEKTKKKKTTIVKFNEQIQTKIIDEHSFEEETTIIKEDIYGRMIDPEGNLVKNNSSK